MTEFASRDLPSRIGPSLEGLHDSTFSIPPSVVHCNGPLLIPKVKFYRMKVDEAKDSAQKILLAFSRVSENSNITTGERHALRLLR